MIRMKIFTACLFLLFFPLHPANDVFAGGTREDCRVCGMWIDQYMHTRHVLVDADGNLLTFCSYTCAAGYMKKHAVNVKKLQAADYLTADLVDADKAYYLVGSDAPPVMSYTSIIAFAGIETAADFQKQHGGRIMSLAEVQAGY
jgi:copper chaperone NosL